MVAIARFGLLASAIFATSSLAAPTTPAEEAINEFVERFGSKDSEYTVQDLEEFEKRQNGYFAITGIQDGQLGVRLPIQQLAQNPDQWNLFLLGMLNFQNANQSQLLSYYQIAGIHGYPNIAWDRAVGNGGAVGYCPHGNILFPVWHRAYMGLFEMIWKQNVNTVVNQFPSGATRTRYANAANGMRFPYWDWANPGSGNVIPPQITNQYVTVTQPNGQQQQIINPLFRYGYHPLNANDMGNDPTTPYGYWPVTFRWPTRSDRAGVTQTFSQNNVAISQLNGIRQFLRDSTYNLFATCDDYTLMSNNAIKNNRCGNSLESIHDSIHYTLGGDPFGNMRYLWWSSFDPAFWLHHMNVERLFSMWQATYKNSYFNNQWRQNGSTYSLRNGQILNAQTDLSPFHRDSAGNFWRGENIFNHRVFGSTFPEFVGWDGQSSSMRNIVNRLYGNGGARKRDASPDALPQAIESLIDSLPAGPVADLLTPTGKKYEWVVNCQSSRFGLDGSYAVYMFFGQPPSEDPLQWGAAQNLVGQYAVLAQPGLAGKMGSDLIYGTVPITTSLVNQISQGTITDLTPEVVTPFLAKTLQWRVAGPKGAVASNQVPQLQISVAHSEVTPAATDNEFPKFSTFVDNIGATKGKLAGLGGLLSGLGGVLSGLDKVTDENCD